MWDYFAKGFGESFGNSVGMGMKLGMQANQEALQNQLIGYQLNKLKQEDLANKEISGLLSPVAATASMGAAEPIPMDDYAAVPKPEAASAVPQGSPQVAQPKSMTSRLDQWTAIKNAYIKNGMPEKALAIDEHIGKESLNLLDVSTKLMSIKNPLIRGQGFNLFQKLWLANADRFGLDEASKKTIANVDLNNPATQSTLTNVSDALTELKKAWDKKQITPEQFSQGAMSVMAQGKNSLETDDVDFLQKQFNTYHNEIKDSQKTPDKIELYQRALNGDTKAQTILKAMQVDAISVAQASRAPETYASNLLVAARSAGVDPEKVKRNKLTTDEAKLVAESYKKTFGTEGFMQMLMDSGMLGGGAKPGQTQKYDAKGNPIKGQ